MPLDVTTQILIKVYQQLLHNLKIITLYSFIKDYCFHICIYIYIYNTQTIIFYKTVQSYYFQIYI